MSNQKNQPKKNKAGFVGYEDRAAYEKARTETFKYRKIQWFKSRWLNTKRFIKSLWQKPRLLTQKVYWKEMFQLSGVWLVEAIIEGFIANFATHFLLGWQFNFFTLLAHGFVIKRGTSLIMELKKEKIGGKKK